MTTNAKEKEVAIIVEHVTWQADDGKFIVARVSTDGSGEPFIAAGDFGMTISPGDPLYLIGTFEQHARFGHRFRVTSALPRRPEGTTGILKYLGSGRIRGIGKKLAERLVAQFGPETLEVLEHTPERVLQIPGFGRSKFNALSEALKQDAAERRAIIFLRGLGLPPGISNAIAQHFGQDVESVVRSNPYRLIEEIANVGFGTADRVALSLGHGAESTFRVRAGLLHALSEAADEGHVAISFDAARERLAQLLRCPADSIEPKLWNAIADHTCAGVVPEGTGKDQIQDGLRLYLPSLERAEQEVAMRLRSRLAAKPPSRVPRALADDASELSDEQNAAVDLLLQHHIALLSGGPGVGKTTVIREVVRSFREASLEVSLAAPTGRAAKRLALATSFPAQTLHRLLGIIPGLAARRDGTALLAADVLIVDESSMIDLVLFLHILRSISPACRLIVVGDPDQLPSVGPGSVLSDLLSSETVPKVRLTRIFRQEATGRIIETAHGIQAGIRPKAPPRDEQSDFYFIERSDAERGADIIHDLFLNRIPRKFGFSPLQDIQILSPMHRGPCGTEALNQRIQSGLNDRGEPLELRTRRLFEGDRVLVVKNDYDLGVMNGDLGIIREIDRDGVSVSVEFDGRLVSFHGNLVDHLALAYAMTVHKSQGSEFPAVILPWFSDHHLMLRRDVLYTAVTRARRLLVLVGNARALDLAVQTVSRVERGGELRARLQGTRFITPDSISL